MNPRATLSSLLSLFVLSSLLVLAGCNGVTRTADPAPTPTPTPTPTPHANAYSAAAPPDSIHRLLRRRHRA